MNKPDNTKYDDIKDILFKDETEEISNLMSHIYIEYRPNPRIRDTIDDKNLTKLLNILNEKRAQNLIYAEKIGAIIKAFDYERFDMFYKFYKKHSKELNRQQLLNMWNRLGDTNDFYILVELAAKDNKTKTLDFLEKYKKEQEKKQEQENKKKEQERKEFFKNQRVEFNYNLFRKKKFDKEIPVIILQ
jgi:hypothetical protein